MIRIDRVDEGFYYYVSDGVPKRVSKDEVAFLQRGGNVMTAIEQLDASIGPYEAEPVEMPPLEEPDAEKLPSAQWHTHREIGDIQDRLSEWNGRLEEGVRRRGPRPLRVRPHKLRSLQGAGRGE